MNVGAVRSSNTRFTGGLLLLLLLQGCLPRLVVVHDGVQVTVVEAGSGNALEGVKVFSSAATPRALAISDGEGRLSLAPDRSLQWIPLMSEARTYLHLWLCKPGYESVTVAQRGGWNADLRPPIVHRPGEIIMKSGGDGARCSSDD